MYNKENTHCLNQKWCFFISQKKLLYNCLRRLEEGLFINHFQKNYTIKKLRLLWDKAIITKKAAYCWSGWKISLGKFLFYFQISQKSRLSDPEHNLCNKSTNISNPGPEAWGRGWTLLIDACLSNRIIPAQPACWGLNRLHFRETLSLMDSGPWVFTYI